MATQSREWQRAGFRVLNRVMVLMWRLGMGRMINSWPQGTGRIMVLGHTGRVSRLRHYTPLNYHTQDGVVYCVAGFGSRADWYRNVLAHPQVELWLPSGRVIGRAEDASGDPYALQHIRDVLIAGAFAAPLLAGIQPLTISDEKLAEAAQEYRLVRITPIEPDPETPLREPIPPEPVPLQPGDLAWVWPVVVLAAAYGLWHALLRGARRKKG